ncbi:DUF1772 domain-containing protein [Bradyrhizobium cytisi]|uniref:DUF1772 domain-containing protein n=1 Tax=Bradyrhizobium cytisi TaxID=515489 RepID=UPI001FE54A93|nr:DUF1772 domain-containing protein [Bradyrhizobium cytisi]
MMQTLKILAVIVTSIPMALSLAHALELPGKYRLDRDSYLAMQSVYYPGFTVGGAAEPLSILIVLPVVLMQSHTVALWLAVPALVSLIAMHAIFWMVTQPVNRFWLTGAHLSELGASFFAGAPAAERDWCVTAGSTHSSLGPFAPPSLLSLW